MQECWRKWRTIKSMKKKEEKEVNKDNSVVRGQEIKSINLKDQKAGKLLKMRASVTMMIAMKIWVLNPSSIKRKKQVSKLQTNKSENLKNRTTAEIRESWKIAIWLTVMQTLTLKILAPSSDLLKKKTTKPKSILWFPATQRTDADKKSQRSQTFPMSSLSNQMTQFLDFLTQ